MPTKKQNLKGFTIIEVVLVLAIAGLIFLMVFVALPALQRSQKDTQRRQDYADLSAAISNYMTNNNGKLPPNGAKLPANEYINATGETPDGEPYTIKVVDASTATSIADMKASNKTTVYVYTHADCSDEAAKGKGSKPAAVESSRAYAIYGPLESGSYCQKSK